MKLSVILPVYNGAKFVDEAVRSIREQTFRDFELIIINDGSTDDSGKILAAHVAEDSRICLVNRENRGLIKTLNEGLALATGEYLARMDADDISVPERFEKQLAYLESHPECVLLGSSIMLIDEHGHELKKVDYCVEPMGKLMRYCAIAHPTVAGRTEAFRRLGGYREAYKHAEDYDLWLRMAESGKLVNLPDYLLRYRIHQNSIGMRYTAEQTAVSAVAVKAAKLRRAGDCDPTQDCNELTPDILKKMGMTRSRIDIFVMSRPLGLISCFITGTVGESELNKAVATIDSSCWRRSSWLACHEIYWKTVVSVVKRRDMSVMKRFSAVCRELPVSIPMRIFSVITFPARIVAEIWKRVFL